MVVDYELLGQNIKYYRTRKRMKQAELAELVDVSTPHISHIECAKTKPSLSVVMSIAAALGTDIYALVGTENPSGQVDRELMTVFQDATTEQRQQCLAICQAAIKYGAWPQKV